MSEVTSDLRSLRLGFFMGNENDDFCSLLKLQVNMAMGMERALKAAAEVERLNPRGSPALAVLGTCSCDLRSVYQHIAKSVHVCNGALV